MKLVYLGTSAAAPTPERSLTCICLVRDSEVLMFDAGEGAQVAYLKAGLHVSYTHLTLPTILLV